MRFNRIYLIIIFVVFSILYFWKSFLFPHGMLDAWALWNVKGKVYALNFLEGNPFQFVINHITHPGYPLVLPLDLAFFSILSGAWSFKIPIFYNYFHFLIYFYLIYRYSINQDWNGKIIPILLIFTAFFAPGMILIITDQCADFPIGCHLAFLFFLTFEIKDNKLNPVKGFYFVGLCLAIILNSKMEGSIILLILLPCFLYYMRLYINKLTIFSLSMGLVFYLVFFLVYKMKAPELNPVPVNFEHIFNSLISWKRYFNVLKYFFLLHALVFFIPFVVIGYFIKQKISLELFIPIALLHLAYSGIFVITSSDQAWHLETAYTRIHLQLFPAFSLIGVYLLFGDKYKLSAAQSLKSSEND